MPMPMPRSASDTVRFGAESYAGGAPRGGMLLSREFILWIGALSVSEFERVRCRALSPPGLPFGVGFETVLLTAALLDTVILGGAC
jgi:hypothetical protein